MNRPPTIASLELDFGDRPVVESWFPGETLFSLVSRHHLLTGHAKASETCVQLFGHPRIGSSHDLPGRIESFVRRTNGRYGSAASVIYKHTLLPYYLPFRSARESANAIAAMSGEAVGALKARLGILATRFGAAHPLKACQCCIQQDEAKYHVGYWHLEHQLPGVWICPWHGEMLWVATVKWMGVDRFGWYLPANASLSPWNSGAASQKPDEDLLLRLADAAVALLYLPQGFYFLGERLAQLYHQTMVERGLCSISGRIHTVSFGKAILEVTRALSCIRELSNLPQSKELAALRFGRLLYEPKSTAHPLLHLILILGLFDRWEVFSKGYQGLEICSQDIKTNHSGTPINAVNSGTNGPNTRSEFLASLAALDGSIHAAANRTGISVSTAMAWAAAAGIAVQRRPKILIPELRVKLIRVLRRGVGKKAVAQAFGVSVQTVTTTLRTEVGLHERWTRVRFERAKREARRSWVDTSSRLAAPTPKVLRTLQPAVFAWLYRNDRSWLEKFATQLPWVPRSIHATINWDQRDEKMSVALKQAVLAWHEHHTEGYLTNARLCQLVPELKSRLSNLDRMPLTRTVLSQVSRRRQKLLFML